MGQLETTVRELLKLNELIAQHREIFESNEAQTSSSLIEPMLRVLGWNVSDPSEVVRQYSERSGIPDYVFKDRRSFEPVMVLEAKRLGEDLEKAKEQVAMYCDEFGISEAVVSDGDNWIGLQMPMNEFPDEDDIDVEFKLLEVAKYSVTRGDAVINAINAQWFTNPLSRQSHWLSETAYAIQQIQQTSSPAKIPEFSIADTSYRDDIMPSLASLRGMNNPPVPSKLYFTDGFVLSVYPAKWSECVRGIAVYLADFICELSADDCPIESPRARTRYVANDRPRHINGQRFVKEREVGDGVFVELSLNARSAVEAACTLLEARGENPNAVGVSLDNNP